MGTNGSNIGITIDNAGQLIADTSIVGHTIYAHSFRTHYNIVVPDYVFDDNYDLKPLSEVESYIRQHKHLPDVPSDAEYKQRGVIDVQELNLLLLRKVEELTLHLIELNKKTDELRLKIEKK